MNKHKVQESNQDSLGFNQDSNFMPLVKKDTVKKSVQVVTDNQSKIDELSYQIVEELSIITPLSVHPKNLCKNVETYFYQKKSFSRDHELFKKPQEREKVDFIGAITSLFRKSFSKNQNKFTVLLPNGLVYFFTETQQSLPKLVISTQNQDFSRNLEKQGIKFRMISKQEYERERILIEGQYIRLFYGYFLNWALSKDTNVDIYSNYLFDYAFKELPLIVKFEQHRNQYDHIRYVQDSILGEKKSKLFLIKLQSMWGKDDIIKIDETLRQYEKQHEENYNYEKIQHEYEFKICKFTVNLHQRHVRRIQDSQKDKIKDK